MGNPGVLFLGSVLLACALGWVQGKLHGITHSPLSKDRSNICIDQAQLLRNMELVSENAENFRVYAIGSCPSNTMAILDFARKKEMGVYLGLWISHDLKLNALELKMLRRVAAKYQDVIKAVVVGNEPVFVIKMDLEDVLKYMSKARKILKKKKVNIPITTAEVWPLFTFNETVGTALADASDFICMQNQPYWEGLSARCADEENPKKDCVDAGEHVELKAQEIEDLYKKKVVICETGWPTFGEKCCEEREFAQNGHKAIPSEENAQKFMCDLIKATKKTGREYFYHEAIDADWKRIWAPCNECVGLSKEIRCGDDIPADGRGCELDYHWGLFTDSLTKKNITVPTSGAC